MSHIVRIQTEVRDGAAVFAACRRRQLAEPVAGKHRLFSSEVEGLAVNLRDWSYPAVCKLETGEVLYDNFGGRWGEQRELDQFMQAYAVEKSPHSQCTSCYEFCHLVTRGSLLVSGLAA